jgi:hypothetical protein
MVMGMGMGMATWAGADVVITTVGAEATTTVDIRLNLAPPTGIPEMMASVCPPC